ncbi:MAG: PilW family protein [Chromatiales bacterium]|nr:PilW family protein [Chromatiales bacterium]
MRQLRGISLVELMVGMSLSLLVIGAALSLHARASQAQRLADNRIRLGEQLVFAVGELAQDVRLAGFHGLLQDPANVLLPSSLQVPCRVTGSDASAWILRLEQPVELQQGAWTLPCPGVSPRPDSDVLVLRRSGPKRSSPDAGRLQLHAGPAAGAVFADGTPPPLPDGPAFIHDLALSAWYVSQHSSTQPGAPALRRLVLGHPARVIDDEVIAGVEHFRITLGLDTTGDGRADTWSREPAPEAIVVAVRAWLLLRAPLPEAGLADTPWLPEGAESALIPGETPGYPAGYPRRAARLTWAVRNARHP